MNDELVKFAVLKSISQQRQPQQSRINDGIILVALVLIVLYFHSKKEVRYIHQTPYKPPAIQPPIRDAWTQRFLTY